MPVAHNKAGKHIAFIGFVFNNIHKSDRCPGIRKPVVDKVYKIGRITNQVKDKIHIKQEFLVSLFSGYP